MSVRHLGGSVAAQSRVRGVSFSAGHGLQELGIGSDDADASEIHTIKNKYLKHDSELIVCSNQGLQDCD